MYESYPATLLRNFRWRVEVEGGGEEEGGRNNKGVADGCLQPSNGGPRGRRVAIFQKPQSTRRLNWAMPPITAATTEEGTDDAQRAPLHLRVQRPRRPARALLQPPQSPIRTLIAADNDSSGGGGGRDRGGLLVQWSLRGQWGRAKRRGRAKREACDASMRARC